MVKLNRISLNKHGLTKFFSPNEVRILELLWARQRMTSGEIQKKCNDLSLACVAGTLDRLVKSEFVGREIDKSGNKIRYIYYPIGNRDEMGSQISEKIISNLIDTFGDATINTLGRMKRK